MGVTGSPQVGGHWAKADASRRQSISQSQSWDFLFFKHRSTVMQATCCAERLFWKMKHINPLQMTCLILGSSQFLIDKTSSTHSFCLIYNGNIELFWVQRLVNYCCKVSFVVTDLHTFSLLLMAEGENNKASNYLSSFQGPQGCKGSHISLCDHSLEETGSQDRGWKTPFPVFPRVHIDCERNWLRGVCFPKQSMRQLEWEMSNSNCLASILPCN